MGLKRFDNNLPTKKKSIKQIIMVLCICLVAVISVTSYAIFQVRHSKPIADAKVGKFKNSDIVLEILIDGEKSETFPEKENNKVFKELTCTNGGVAEWDSETWELSIIDISGPTECTVSFEKEKTASEKLTELAKTDTEEMFTDDTEDANIRYMGADPNNYVSLGDGYYNEDLYYGYGEDGDVYYPEEYTSLEECQIGKTIGGTTDRYNNNCTKIHSKGDPILWRIIGIMNNVDDGTGAKETRIKVIRERPVGRISWDRNCLQTVDEEAGTCSGTTSNNNWETSSLNKTLNEAFYNNIKTTVANYGSADNSPYKWQKLDFSTNGMKQIQYLTKDTVYHLGGSTGSEKTVKQYYDFERGKEKYGSNPTTWTGKVGLMYASDYGYATSGGNIKNKAACSALILSRWNSSGSEDCKNNNWLYKSISATYPQWTIVPFSHRSDFVMTLYYGGRIFNMEPNNAFVVRPVLYLRPDVKIIDGEGTKDHPYTIGL